VARFEWKDGCMAWDGEEYQQRFDALAESGVAVHGEVDFVMTLAPRSVLDAGCGSGRVAQELEVRGIEVVGVDAEPSMIDAARRRRPDLPWVVADVGDVDLGRTFDVVVMAGNVPLFTPVGTQTTLVAGCARHVGPGGALVAGFQLGRGYDVDAYDADCGAAGLVLEARWATWDGAAFPGDGSYAVSVHRSPVLAS
jgi:SAM-dependent methyltransferase